MVNPNINIPKNKIAEFCHRWKVAEFSLFGSILTRNFRPDSDIDILVDFTPDAKWSHQKWNKTKQKPHTSQSYFRLNGSYICPVILFTC